jgi:hypothetical protein
MQQQAIPRRPLADHRAERIQQRRAARSSTRPAPTTRCAQIKSVTATQRDERRLRPVRRRTAINSPDAGLTTFAPTSPTISPPSGRQTSPLASQQVTVAHLQAALTWQAARIGKS